jgi:CAAX protease family protein
VTGEVKPWGYLATLGLGAGALLGGQFVGLMSLIWWSGQGIAHWADFARDGVAVTIIICISTPVQVLLLVLMVKPTGSSVADYLGLNLPVKRDIMRGMIAILLYVVVSDGTSWLLGRDVVTPFQNDIYRTASAAGWLPWLFLTIVVVTPIGEEILFRGFLFRGWYRPPHGPWIAIAVTALLWAIVHVQYDLFVIAQVFVCGLVFGWVRWTTGSTILTMVLHGLINCAGILETMIAFRS